MHTLAKIVCLSLCVCFVTCNNVPFVVESRAPPQIVALPPAIPPPFISAPLSQIPIVAGSVKSPPRIVAPPPGPAPLPVLPPPPRARVGVKTVVRQPPPPPPVQVVEQQEIIAPIGAAEPFAFNYDVKDEYGNVQFRKEEGDTRGAVRGSYGYTDANGLYRIVDYVADQDGFRANIRSNEPGLVDSVANPADITLAAEQPPLKIREEIRNIRPYAGKLRSARAPVNEFVEKPLKGY